MATSYRVVYRFRVPDLFLSLVFLLSFYSSSQQSNFGFPWAPHRSSFISYSSASNKVLKDFKGFCWHRFCLWGIFYLQKNPLLPSNPKFLLIQCKSTGSNPNEGLFSSFHLITVFVSFRLFSSLDTQRHSQGSFAGARGPQLEISGLSVGYNTQRQIVFNPKPCRWKPYQVEAAHLFNSQP